MLLQLRDRLRRADAGNHIFALGVDQKFAVKHFLAGGGIAGESHAGAGIDAGIAENHRLHVHGRAPFLGNVVFPAVNDGAIVHPGAEHGADRSLQLCPRIVGKLLCRCALSPAL